MFISGGVSSVRRGQRMLGSAQGIHARIPRKRLRYPAKPPEDENGQRLHAS